MPPTLPEPTPRQRLDEAAERYRTSTGEARDGAWTERQAALQDIIAEHARWAGGEAGSARANLADANLADANLAGADLAGAYLAYADLAGADLARANLADANLAGANLADADLAGANLARAYLARANLADANLAGANLAAIWQDIDNVLRQVPHEVPALLAALRDGKVDGSSYQGECACLVGTLEQACGHRLPRDASRLAERWFSAIRQGDTPANSAACALTAEYVEWWLSPQSDEVPA